jgi:hypothetical protein
MTEFYDDQERQTATRIERENPRWLVMWGAYSRLYWAFPRFNGPPGMIIAAPDPGELLARMRRIEVAVHPAPSAETAPPWQWQTHPPQSPYPPAGGP